MWCFNENYKFYLFFHYYILLMSIRNWDVLKLSEEEELFAVLVAYVIKCFLIFLAIFEIRVLLFKRYQEIFYGNAIFNFNCKENWCLLTYKQVVYNVISVYKTVSCFWNISYLSFNVFIYTAVWKRQWFLENKYCILDKNHFPCKLRGGLGIWILIEKMLWHWLSLMLIFCGRYHNKTFTCSKILKNTLNEYLALFFENYEIIRHIWHRHIPDIITAKFSLRIKIRKLLLEL